MKSDLKLLPIPINRSLISLLTLAVSNTLLVRTDSITDHGFRGLFMLLSIRPQLVLSRPSPYFA
ncbi:hypothetical protein PITC_067010 [Penicillium italicum]|uniref:Uncharacterized protein n=1 Tax=Penicillium italicum TaxID=40296 RepID=A0A0A2KPX4_PENIT|nr:hypothetical protein PITC_067010 [Penicillium italicum]